MGNHEKDIRVGDRTTNGWLTTSESGIEEAVLVLSGVRIFTWARMLRINSRFEPCAPSGPDNSPDTPTIPFQVQPPLLFE